jgi:Flp pilus assembly protein TadD
MTRPRDSFLFSALSILAVALIMRGVHVWQLGMSPFAEVLMGDARGYDAWAQRIAQGDWIGSEVFYQAPLYPYFLGTIYALAGHDLFIVRLVQAVLGSLASLAIGIAGWRLFSARVGLVAGLLFALYPTAIFFDGLIQKSSLDGFFTCVALALIGTIMARREPRWLWLALGVTMGLLSLTRENALLLAGVVAAWSIWNGTGVGGRQSAVMFLLLGLALVLTPVAIRNYAVGGGFYLTTSQFGPNFFIGNNPAADGTYMSLRFGRGAPEFERRDATELAERAKGRTLTPAEVSTYWTDRAMAFISAEPGRWLRLMLRKSALLVNATEMLDTESQESHAEWSWPLGLLGWLLHFGVLVPLAVAGTIVAWPQRSRLWILYALTITYAASVIVFFVFARYRYPLAPFLILFASVAVGRLARWPGGSDQPPPRLRRSAEASAKAEDPPLPKTVTRALVASVGLAAVIANWPLLSAKTMKAITETNLALALQESGAAPRAIEHYRRAIALDSTYAPAYSNLGTALRATGDYPSAIVEYERALALLPTSPEILVNLGNAKMGAGDLPGAVDLFRKAAQIDASPETRAALARATYDLGSALLERSAFVEAEARLRESIAIDPGNAEAHNNLGIALASQGRMDAAIAAFRRATEIKPGFADAQQNLEMALRSLKP